MFDQNAIVNVQSEWNGWRTAEVSLRDLEEIHWFQPQGAPHKLAHAYVSCGAIRAGDLPHRCADTPGPHRMLVCVLKRHVPPSTYAEITRRADHRALPIAPATLTASADASRSQRFARSRSS